MPFIAVKTAVRGPRSVANQDSQSRTTHCVRTKVAIAKHRARIRVSRMYLILLYFMVPQRGLLGASRLAPSGSACGRSNWLRQFVEPAFCLSGVRIGRVVSSAPSTVAQ